VSNHDLRVSAETLSVSSLNGSALTVPISIDFVPSASSPSVVAPSVSLVDDSASGAPNLRVRVSIDGGNHVVDVSGELDVRTRRLVEQACLTGHDLAVVVDMSGLTFMDCCGYAGLIAIRRALLAQGGSLTLTNQSGQPARLLDLLGAAELVRRVETTA
jgi:anti-anti-sigma factor